jgi:hypothetical protein
MLMGAVPWPIQFGDDDDQRKKKCSKMCMSFDFMCLTVTIFLTIIVPMLIKPPWIERAVGMFLSPWLLVGGVFLFRVVCEGRDQKQDNQPGFNQAGEVINIIDQDSHNTLFDSTDVGDNNQQSGHDDDLQDGNNRPSDNSYNHEAADPPSGSNDGTKPVVSKGNNLADNNENGDQEAIASGYTHE